MVALSERLPGIAPRPLSGSGRRRRRRRFRGKGCPAGDAPSRREAHQQSPHGGKPRGYLSPLLGGYPITNGMGSRSGSGGVINA